MPDRVTDASLAIYRWALSRRRFSAANLVTEFDLTDAQASTLLHELVDSRLIRAAADANGYFYAIGLQPNVDITLPIEAEIDRLRRKMLLLRMMFKRLLSTYQDEDCQAYSADHIESLATAAEVRAALSSATQECKRELLDVHDQPAHSFGDALDAGSNEQDLLTRGVAVCRLYPHSARGHRAISADVDRRTDAGVEVRTTGQVLERMVVLDRTVAFVPDRRPGGDSSGAVIVQNSAVVGLLCTWFDAAWKAGRPFARERADYAAASSETQALIVQMLAAGMKDEMIARRLGVSLRTCRRHVAELMERLGATSRFQAGVNAVQQRLLR